MVVNYMFRSHYKCKTVLYSNRRPLLYPYIFWKNGDKRGVVNADKRGQVPLLLSFTNICKDTNAYKGWQLISDLKSKKWLQKAMTNVAYLIYASVPSTMLTGYVTRA